MKASTCAVVKTAGDLVGVLARYLLRRSLATIQRNPKVAVCVGIGALYYYRKSVRKYVCRAKAVVRLSIGPKVFTYLIDRTSCMLHAAVLRDQFRLMSLEPMEQRSIGHSHPLSSADRTGANNAIDRYVTQVGWETFSNSMSARDIRAGNDGSRYYYFAKDCAMPSRNSAPKRGQVIKMIDVDYYGNNVPEYMSKMHPMLLYTFVPQHCGGSVVDGVFSIKDDIVHYQSNGGAKYEHRLWDYDTDHLVVDDWLGSSVYLVESKKTCDPDRRLVALFPVRRIWGPLGWFLPGKRLERRKISYPGVNIIRYLDTNVPMVSFSSPGHDFACNIPASTWFSIAVRLETKVTKELIVDVTRGLKYGGLDDKKSTESGAHVFALLQHIRAVADFVRLPVLSDTGKAIINDASVHYQTLLPHPYEDGTHSARITSAALCHFGNVAPVRSINNDTSCVQVRILDAVNRAGAWPGRYWKYAEEFITHLVPTAQRHSGVPMDLEQVFELQARPSQKSSAADAMPWAYMYRLTVKAFQKAETYAKVCASRAISTVNADHRTRYSSYIYPLTSSLLKPQKWYAFSKDPLDVANSVMAMARGSTYIVPTDFSAWDATHSEDLAKFELALCLRFFSTEYHSEISQLVMEQYRASAVTRHGVKYNSGWARLSGSSDTSAFNSVDNALVMYITNRESGMGADLAWNRLGLFGGDDGLMADVDTVVLEKVVKRMGHKIKAKKVYRNTPDYVTFLGRHYLDPWTTASSMADIQRQVRKLHLTVSPVGVPLDVALYNRAVGILDTDVKTPILGSWAVWALTKLETKYRDGQLDSLLTASMDNLRADRSWWSKFASDRQFPQDEWDSARSLEIAAADLGVDATTIVEVNSSLLAGELPVGVFDHLERNVTIEAQLGDEILRPSPPSDTATDTSSADNGLDVTDTNSVTSSAASSRVMDAARRSRSPPSRVRATPRRTSPPAAKPTERRNMAVHGLNNKGRAPLEVPPRHGTDTVRRRETRDVQQVPPMPRDDCNRDHRQQLPDGTQTYTQRDGRGRASDEHPRRPPRRCDPTVRRDLPSTRQP